MSGRFAFTVYFLALSCVTVVLLIFSTVEL